MDYYCYLIINENNGTYIGITNNLEKRLKQHNGILSGGAKATRKSNKWKYKTTIKCKDKIEACKIEWIWKHKKVNNKWIRTYGLLERILRIQYIQDNFSEVYISTED